MVSYIMNNDLILIFLLGNIKLFLDKPITIKSIRVVFKCEEWDKKKGPSCTLFSVESCIWSQKQGKKRIKSNRIITYPLIRAFYRI